MLASSSGGACSGGPEHSQALGLGGRRRRYARAPPRCPGADVHGRIVLWNPAAERLFGFTEAEAVGRSLDLIIPERFRERHWTGYRLP